ncbi:MAG TPA: signal peptidase II [Burkholderiaceae bacterium]|nr:signal peptidase II [Burkholderiaceae bacterium]
MARRRKAPGLSSWLAIAGLVLVVDQLTKAWILSRFRVGERLEVVPGLFDLTLVYNPGAAFSFLASHDGWQRWFFVAIGIAASAFILWLLVRHGSQRLFAGALSLILGGAIGNVIDRLVHGQVVDFLLVHWADRWYFPAFNAADSAITVGAVLLVLDELLRVRKSD